MQDLLNLIDYWAMAYAYIISHQHKLYVGNLDFWKIVISDILFEILY